MTMPPSMFFVDKPSYFPTAVQHAVPYPMMMPPGQHVPHPYEGAPPPVPMGGVGHA
jgi:hypothetical protein